VLLEHGADVRSVARNPMQVQALHAAVAGRSGESVRLLLDAGADPNARQHGGWTPLMAARQHGDQPVIDMLLAAGADPSDHPPSGNEASTS
jgi:ankyrin repeat protein